MKRQLQKLLLVGFIGSAGMLLVPEPLVAGLNEIPNDLNEEMVKFRRLDRDQYVRTIQNIFGSDIDIPGRFAPPYRDSGLTAIGDGLVSITPAGFEQSELRARDIALQVLSEGKRERILDCAPESDNEFDQNCARQFISRTGRLIYRRPLSSEEQDVTLAVINQAFNESEDFYESLEAGLSRLLVSPHFLFRVEKQVLDPESGTRRLDDYSLATRISFLLWDAPPDGPLLDAAERGDLRTPEGLSRQVQRLISSPQYENGVRAFFSDMWSYEQFAGLSKDQTLYPKYSSLLAEYAKEQSLKTIVDHLITRKGDYRDLFTTRNTFMNRRLGSLYKVPVVSDAFEGWVPYTFDQQSQRKGILSLAGFLMLDPTHEGDSSPTIRGKQVRELVMCQHIPDPPPDIDFTQFSNPDPNLKTTRDKLVAHRENPVCAGCHGLMDPIGLSIENYNPIGEYRTHQNGVEIDASGSLEGVSFNNLVELGSALRDNNSVASCVAQRAFEYGVGRSFTSEDRGWFKSLMLAFAASGYRLDELLLEISTSPHFQEIYPAPNSDVAFNHAVVEDKY